MAAKRYFRANRGFTLIELSIVLVIIGLIVGGVLVGQNLISAAAARAQISQIEKYNTAVNAFRDKYGGLPGDLSIVSANQFGFLVPTDCTGIKGQRDGNGLIEAKNGTATLAALMGENLLFWSDLSTAHLGGVVYPTGSNLTYDANCTNSITTAVGQTPLPEGKIGNGNLVHVYSSNGANWFLLADIAPFSSASSVLVATSTIPVAQAYAMDTKIDDGFPLSGNVQAVLINGSQFSTIQATNAATDSASTCFNTSTFAGVYSIAYQGGTGANCSLSFKMQAGD